MNITKALKNYARNHYHTGNFNNLGIISGKEWKADLQTIPYDLRGGDDFTQYVKQVKPTNVYGAQICTDTLDDPSGYEINQYPKPMAFSQAKEIMKKNANSRK